MAETIIADPERALALSYVPREGRAGLAALWALDEMLGAILRSGRDPMVSQLRLTWWHDALCRLDQAPPPSRHRLIQQWRGQRQRARCQRRITTVPRQINQRPALPR